MNTQEMFDTVCIHLLAQNEKAKSYNGGIEHGNCVYKTSRGLKCAVGCLIADEHYNSNLEGKGIEANVPATRSPRNAVEKSIGRELTIKEIRLLSRLQRLHDGYSPEEWPSGLSRIARRFELNFNEPAA